MAAEHPEAAKQLAVVAENVGSRLTEVSRDIVEHVTAKVPDLRGDETVIAIFQASVTEHVAMVLHVFENDISLDNVEGSAAAVEYVRRMAQRDVPLATLTRGYRIGQLRLLEWCLDELDRQGADYELSTATNRRMLRLSFGYLDRIAEHAGMVYQQERDHWLLGQTAARAARVRDLLAEKDVDLNWAEPALGYRIRQNHLGLVAWLPTLTGGGEGLARLDRITNEIGRELDCPATPLFVPRDAVLSWAWLPFGSRNDVSWEQLSNVVERSDPPVQVCAGSVGYGIEGFRSTHRQALRTQELAAAASPAPQFTDFSTVAPIALMATNVDDMRAWVWRVLGPLAVDDENSARLRKTAQIFLDTGFNYTATASAQILHKNTVKYRIRKVEAIMGHPVQQGHADLEVALRAVQYLGSTLLRTRPA
ncbi:helix-turn-helix domain-containing protein [Streptomyces sp. NPDC001982]|uniref:PucR family transcriptional regulator n=1 Tax=Streptomyces sp. NPDC001982 TaxID=3154405 RepID=UPI003331217A